ncbi:ABC transporter substrate-binding protein [Kitasatospora aureofaciens]|uniref:Peptide ABC transporter substrate-binding protein n=1 Tax=Kitasatospora aureofaciens TaxID=1894 RepID=A0A1E7MWT5_KITAU|nr:ABC transporter substrate-binding protein [Kitasatospora aureofaciens]QEV00072.1 ABC transporter substrate-binding protein [Streptomyces viridifaciens]ARF78868.1 peptide ABC transporter substrate-binding protein [Kitasatospora aureofaciens]OEV32891.1 peptide ABC transporter substrate-binding protein [Kitasatospora aureofaciens]UKZ06258.1 ABC transporter substrate-binding protein [Streptomyces viridifaciens]GGU76719.1 peptide ABC transporter substrate-binding protein [Kitasatospora aureofaci
MRGVSQAKWVVAAVAVALAATACSSGGSSDSSGGSSNSAAVDPAGTFSFQSGEPQRPLQPANAMENQGGRIVKQLFMGLVDYDPATGALRNQVADKIETTDAKNYTVTLKSGWTFHDGTPVTAKSFVDSWNWSANPANNQINSDWFSDIAGYDAVHPDKGDPTAKEMTGLKVVDDTHFTIELTAPVSYFTYKLGYSAFYPLPTGFFADPKGYGEKPVGNGPYQFVSWEHNKAITLKAYDKYAGSNKAKNGGIVFRNYTSSEAAYKDLMSDTLDVLDQVDSTDLPKYKDDLGKRAIDQAQGAIQNISFAMYNADWKDPAKAKVRQGLSMAIDRDTITKTVLNNSRQPADAFVAPGVMGYKAGTCGDACKYDPAKAKQLIQEGGGVPGNKITIIYNSDGGHKEWVDAVCNSIRQATGVECLGDPKPDFKTSRDIITKKQVPSMMRTGWVQDYPLNANFLRDVYGTGAAANDAGYSSPEFDKLAHDADAATSVEKTADLYQQAEAVLAKDMPAIPLWYYKTNSGYSNNVQNVKFDSFGNPVYTDVEVKKK